ncbi:MAG: hypothetical protein WC517_04360 [Patescibacteria group bacterium]
MNFYDTMKKKANEQVASDLNTVKALLNTQGIKKDPKFSEKESKDVYDLWKNGIENFSNNPELPQGELNDMLNWMNTTVGEEKSGMKLDGKFTGKAHNTTYDKEFLQRDPSAGVVKANALSNAELGRAIKRAVYEGLEVKGKPKVNQDFDANMTGVIEALHGKKPMEKKEALVPIEVAAKILKNAGYNDAQITKLLEIVCK